MRIKEIEIDNFKSFAQKVNIPFLEGFTTISGPNGSGKSNIIDSILFALGLSSSRALRAEKLFHLICTLTKKNEATVKITFETSADEEPLVIMRKIKKSSQGFNSIYYLNGKIATLSEIHEKLAVYNISPNSYNVIMQGDVMAITNTSPLERRRILDEIAGVADFDRRIEQAEKELETVEERVEKSNIILAEIDVRFAQLEEERKQALKYQQLKEEKQEYESKLSAVKYFDMKASLERLHESILDADKSKKQGEQELKKLKQQLEETSEKLREIQQNVNIKGEAEQIEIKKHAESLKGSISRKKDAIIYADKQIEDNKKTVENTRENIETLKEKIEDTLLKIEAKKDEIKIIEENISQEKEELNKVLSEVAGINQAADEHVQKRNNLRKLLENVQDSENALIKQKLPTEEKLSRLKKEIDDSKDMLEQFEESKEVYSNNQNMLQAQIEELSKELKDYELVQKNTMYELDKVKNEINDSNYNMNLAVRKIASLEAQKRAVEDANFGRAIDTVLNSGLEGVHAPLAKLGQVDKEYSTALEIAMGGRMLHIVVDDDEVAAHAIEILKTSKAGRAGFLPLNKLKRAPYNMNPPKGEGIVDYAFNLIDFDDIYEDAFYHALGETLVVEDIGTARRLFGKYRMVTLDGSLFEKSGLITGGSVRQNTLKFSQNEDEELALYKKRLADMETNHKSLEAKRTELDKKQEKTRQDYSSAMNELNKKKIEYDNVVRNLETTKLSIEQRKKVIEENAPQISALSKELDKLEQEHIKLTERITQLHDQIEDVERQMPQDELSKLRELTENIEFEIKQNESKILNCNNAIKGFEMEIDFQKESIKNHEDTIKKLEESNVTLARDKERYASEIAEVEVQLKELDAKIAEIGQKLVELQKERDGVQSELIENEKKISVLETKIERITEQIEAFKTRRKELEPQLVEIREELIAAGYEIAQLKPLEISTEEVMRNINRLQKRMDEMGAVNMRAITEYEDVKSRQDELRTKLETLSNEKIQITERMHGYETLKRESFMKTFTHVNENFKEIFAELSEGEGQLILENPDDPLGGGLTIEAQPRDKKMQRLESMSGGEKSLTALAFVFAIQKYMPAPFYAFDEVDQSLDGINVEKLANIVRKQSENTQFIVVSHRKPMIESANQTVGVTQKDQGITKVTGVKLSD